jgi:hypothetical protein
MTKAILLLDPHAAAQGPAILCAESAEEAQSQRLPLFGAVFAQLSAGLEPSPNGSDYELFEKGKHVGALEIFAPALLDGSSDAD